MKTIPVQEAQKDLLAILSRLLPGDEVTLTRDGHPIGTLRPLGPTPSSMPRRLGTLSGSVQFMAPDFDAIPEGFEEYIE